jgi:hypothetical protein
MDISMGVDTTGHTTRCFQSGHGHPFSQSVQGWHGRSGSERRVVRLVGSKPGQSPHLGDGTCRFQCATGESRSTTPEGVTGLRVGPNLPVLPKLLGTSNQAVDPQRSINVLGHHARRRANRQRTRGNDLLGSSGRRTLLEAPFLVGELSRTT